MFENYRTTATLRPRIEKPILTDPDKRTRTYTDGWSAYKFLSGEQLQYRRIVVNQSLIVEKAVV